GLGADVVAVVARRDVVDVAGREVGGRAVGVLDGERARDDGADMARLAPLAADRRPYVGGPAPAGLHDALRHGEVAQLDGLLHEIREAHDVVGLAEVLRSGRHWEIMACRSPCWTSPRRRVRI